MNKVSESDLRNCIRLELAQHVRSIDAVIHEELCVEGGLTRIDMALISTHLEGFELKSDSDDFRRLAFQVDSYGRVFDRLTLVTGPNMERMAPGAVPRWWGLAVVEPSDKKGMALRWVRHPKMNPYRLALSIAAFLWREESIDLLFSRLGTRPPAKANKAELHRMLSQIYSPNDMRDVVIERLRQRVAILEPGETPIAPLTCLPPRIEML